MRSGSRFVLFQSGTPIVWGQRIMSGQCAIMFSMCLYSLPNVPSMQACVFAGSFLCLAVVFRRYARKWCVRMELEGKQVHLHCVDWMGRVRQTSFPVTRFISTNRSFSLTEKGLWTIAHFQTEKGNIDYIILDRMGSAPNIRLLNSVISGQSSLHINQQ